MKPPIKPPRRSRQNARQAPAKQAVALTATPPPTSAQLAAALGVSTRRIAQLRKLGLPTDSIAAALEWRVSRHTTDTAEELRRQRIKLIESQRRKIDQENSVRSGGLVTVGSVFESSVKHHAEARGALLRLASEIPPRLAGQTPAAIGKILRAEVISVLRRLSENCEKSGIASPGEFETIENRGQ